MAAIIDSAKLINLDLTGFVPRRLYQVDWALTRAKIVHIVPTPHHLTRAIGLGLGYIAGTGDGIATIDGKPAQAEILLTDASDVKAGFIHRTFSLKNGRYLIKGLDPRQRYLILARDLNGNYEPCAYDNLAPASDLTMDELAALWEQMIEPAVR